MVYNKIENNIAWVSKNSQQNNSKTFKNKYNKQISKEKYVFMNWDWNNIIIMQYQKITKVSKSSQQSNSETITKDISLQKKDKNVSII